MQLDKNICVISIHAPHARSDVKNMSLKDKPTNFNPRSSCEERHGQCNRQRDESGYFNPRSSCEERPS